MGRFSQKELIDLHFLHKKAIINEFFCIFAK